MGIGIDVREGLLVMAFFQSHSGINIPVHVYKVAITPIYSCVGRHGRTGGGTHNVTETLTRIYAC